MDLGLSTIFLCWHACSLSVECNAETLQKGKARLHVQVPVLHSAQAWAFSLDVFSASGNWNTHGSSRSSSSEPPGPSFCSMGSLSSTRLMNCSQVPQSTALRTPIAPTPDGLRYHRLTPWRPCPTHGFPYYPKQWISVKVPLATFLTFGGSQPFFDQQDPDLSPGGLTGGAFPWFLVSSGEWQTICCYTSLYYDLYLL